MRTLAGPSDATWIGIRGRGGWVMIFRGLPRPVPFPSGSGIE